MKQVLPRLKSPALTHLPEAPTLFCLRWELIEEVGREVTREEKVGRGDWGKRTLNSKIPKSLEKLKNQREKWLLLLTRKRNPLLVKAHWVLY